MIMKKRSVFCIALFLALRPFSLFAEPICLIDAAVFPDQAKLTGTFVYLPDRSSPEEIRIDPGASASTTAIPFSNDGGRLVFKNLRQKITINFESASEPDRNKNERLIEKDAIVLLSGWHPVPEGACRYRFSVTLPERFAAVSEGETVLTEKQGDTIRYRFSYDHPLDSVSLIASDQYLVKKKRHGPVTLYAYFFKEEAALADTYLEHARSYITRYERLIGPFPYRRFSIVENRLPTGYSFPTFTLLGKSVVRLPFIVKTSLGHEILHQWFGNGVFVDERSGNWCEGLTTYLADHLYAQEEGQGIAYRKNLMIDFSETVPEHGGYPIGEFGLRKTALDRVIGYNQSAMFFHMLRKMGGDKLFFDSLRLFVRHNLFQRASYDDIKKAFDVFARNDYDEFFEQWTKKNGVADFQIEELKVLPDRNGFLITGAVRKKDPFSYPLLMRIITEKTVRNFTLRITKESTPFHFNLEDRPVSLFVDPQWDIARNPTKQEIAPRLSKLFASDAPLFVVSKKDEPKIVPLMRLFTDPELVAPERVDLKQLRSRTVVFVGASFGSLRHYFTVDEQCENGFSIRVRNNPYMTDRFLGYICSDSADETAAVAFRLPHYGKYSSLDFEKGEIQYKGMDAALDGMEFPLSTIQKPWMTPSVTEVQSIDPAVFKKRVLYVGEIHNRFGHHENQLKIIEQAFRLHPDLAIGFEMFDRDVQPFLDEWVAGKRNEIDFIRKSRYFESWGFDYRLYRPIFLFAKEHRIPMIGLNINREIVSKIGKNGLASLSESDRRMVPDAIDLSSQHYRSELRKSFQMHSFADDRFFENFFAAQVVRDETMADTIHSFLGNHRETNLVVLAGNGHLAYRYGIPDRLQRRGAVDDFVFLQETPIDRGVGDALLFPEVKEGRRPIVLGVMLAPETEPPTVQGLAPGGPAAAGNIRIGDRIIAINGVAIHDFVDLKIALSLCECESGADVTIIRDEKQHTVHLKFDR